MNTNLIRITAVAPPRRTLMLAYCTGTPNMSSPAMLMTR